jgi:hypothetical protein
VSARRRETTRAASSETRREKQLDVPRYYDRDVGDLPGTHVLYTVSTVVDGGAQAKETTTALFTSPWIGMLTVSVMTESGSPVRDAVVHVSHLNKTGGIDLNYARMAQGSTDYYGARPR